MALDGVAGAITDAVHAATLMRVAQGAYDPPTGTYQTTEATQTGRAVFANERPIADVFPEYVAGPSDQLIMLEGFTSCRENDRLTIGGVARDVRQVQDIAGAGTVFYVVAR